MLHRLYFVSALAKHNENGRGTGGGEGKKLTDAEAIVLEDLNEHASDLVDGNPGGYETSIPLVGAFMCSNTRLQKCF